MITITKEESRCKYIEIDKKKNKIVREARCPQNDDLLDNVKIISYKVYGDIFDCGDIIILGFGINYYRAFRERE